MASSRTKTARTRARYKPKRQALELKGVRALARRDGQHGAQLRGQRGHAGTGGDAAHRSSWLVAIAVASIGVQADSSRNVWSRPLMHGSTSKLATAEPALVACYAPARSYRGIIFGPWHLQCLGRTCWASTLEPPTGKSLRRFYRLRSTCCTAGEMRAQASALAAVRH